MNNKNYAPILSAQTIEKLTAIADIAEATGLFTDAHALDLSEITREPIEWQSRDGYISHNKGGEVLTVWHYGALGSGQYITKGQHKEKERLQEMLRDDFIKEYELTGEATTNYYNHPAFEQYETEFLEDGSDTDLLEFRASIDDADNITLDLSICYKDAPYYRSRYFETIGKLELSLKQFEHISLESVEKYFRRAITRT